MRQSLSSQAMFISDMINKDCLNLYETKEKSQNCNAQEKVVKLKEFKNGVFDSLFA
jgi:hypothetical protein